MISTILVSVGYIANLFWDYTVEKFMFDAMTYIVLGSLGITGVEKFANKTTTDE
jgi:predicted membrane channel-forming protein YqfA (hemolysin III family)